MTKDAEKLTFCLQVRCWRRHSETCSSCSFDLYGVYALRLIPWARLHCRSGDGDQGQMVAHHGCSASTKPWIRKVRGQAQGRHRSRDRAGGPNQPLSEAGQAVPRPARLLRLFLEQLFPQGAVGEDGSHLREPALGAGGRAPGRQEQASGPDTEQK